MCTPSKGQFISVVFLVQKSDGKKRFILNLKNLNKFLSTEHFKIEDKSTAIKLITPGCFMGSVDLKEAYFIVPIAKSHRKYLRFRFDNKLYQFTCLPFGLSTAPFVFTKIMKPVMAFLRANKYYLSVVYLDDFLLLGKTYEECKNNIRETTAVLQNLGFVINYDKSQFIPKQRCKFLGFYLNSTDMVIELPQDKQHKIQKLVQKFQNLKSCKIRLFAHLLGVLTSACPATTYGWVYTKKLERAKYLALKISNDNYNRVMQLPDDINTDLLWWNLNVIDAKKKISPKEFKLEIFSDASKSGWGVVCKDQKAHGHWNALEQSFHINQLELLAAFFGLKCFAKTVRDCDVLLRIDNTTAIAYINRMGGIRYPTLSNLAKEVWQWCEARNIVVFASYIESAVNKEADKESRRLKPETEWQLAAYAFRKITANFGNPDIDLFADRNNTKCENFVSWGRDPEAVGVDAFTISWRTYYFYAFPPFALILRVLQKIINDKTEGILVVPFWPTQPWYPVFTSLLSEDPLYFKPDINLLISLDRTHHPLWSQLTLVAGRLSSRDLHGKTCPLLQ